MDKVVQMPGPEWSYNDVLHAYMLGSKSIPSVTDVMAFTGLSKDLNELPGFVKARFERKGKKGHRIHEATILLDKKELDWGILDADEALYVLGYERASQKYGFNVHVSEEPMIAVKDGVGPYGMKLDRLVEITRGEYKGLWVIDIKTTSVKKLQEWGIQLAAYKYGVQQMGLADRAGIAVLWLRKDHEAEFINMGDGSEELDAFFHGLAIVHFRLRRSGLSWLEAIGKIKKK